MLKKMLFFLVAMAFGISAAVYAETVEKSYPLGNSGEGYVSLINMDQNTAAQVKAFWTKERKMNAQPMVMVREGAPSVKGKAGMDPGKSADGTIMSSLLSGEETIQSTAYVVQSKYTQFPYAQTAKVFFEDKAWMYVCTGSSIGGDAVITAGHCVASGKRKWYFNHLVDPQYWYGADPVAGSWVGWNLLTTTAWYQSGDFCLDYAFIIVNQKAGERISDRVGNLGFAYNQGTSQSWQILGYPAAAPWDGTRMMETLANTSSVDSFCSGGNPIATMTTQTGGCSGGPRMINNGNVNSINSYVYGGYDDELYGPYFDGNTKIMKDDAVAQNAPNE